MKAITADKANEIATNAIQMREKEEKELQEAFNLIREKAEMGAFYTNTRECLSQSNVNVLKSLGFEVLNINNPESILGELCTRISWYKEDVK